MKQYDAINNALLELKNSASKLDEDAHPNDFECAYSEGAGKYIEIYGLIIDNKDRKTNSSISEYCIDTLRAADLILSNILAKVKVRRLYYDDLLKSFNKKFLKPKKDIETVSSLAKNLDDFNAIFSKSIEHIKPIHNIISSDVNRLKAEALKILEENERQKYLKQLEELEAAKSRGKAKGLAELYRVQNELAEKYRRSGIDIEKELVSLRERQLKMEREENNAMVQDILQTLDKV